jgi:hypothetical protein
MYGADKMDGNTALRNICETATWQLNKSILSLGFHGDNHSG